jgi:hypothetical protein
MKGVESTDREHEQAFVILRADLFQPSGTPLEQLVSAKEIVRSPELAEREVARLNALHPDGQVRYWFTYSRLFPPGRSSSSGEAPA